MWIVNPAFIVPDWGKSDVSARANGRLLKRGADYRIGYETKDVDSNLVLWVKMKSQQDVKFVIAPETEL